MCTFKNLVLINDLSVCCNNQPDQKQTQITLTENIKETKLTHTQRLI